MSDNIIHFPAPQNHHNTVETKLLTLTEQLFHMAEGNEEAQLIIREIRDIVDADLTNIRKEQAAGFVASLNKAIEQRDNERMKKAAAYSEIDRLTTLLHQYVDEAGAGA